MLHSWAQCSTCVILQCERILQCFCQWCSKNIDAVGVLSGYGTRETRGGDLLKHYSSYANAGGEGSTKSPTDEVPQSSTSAQPSIKARMSSDKGVGADVGSEWLLWMVASLSNRSNSMAGPSGPAENDMRTSSGSCIISA